MKWIARRRGISAPRRRWLSCSRCSTRGKSKRRPNELLVGGRRRRCLAFRGMRVSFLNLLEERVVCLLGEIACFVEFCLGLFFFAHRSIEAGKAPMDIYIVRHHLFCTREFSQRLFVAASLGVDNSEIEMRQGKV